MKKAHIAVGVVAALVLPILLSGTAYLVSATSLATTVNPVRVPAGKIGRPRTPLPSPSAERDHEQGGDVSGPCDEAEHQDDPQCGSGASPTGRPDDSGGYGSDDSGSGSSGSGSDDSGSSGSGSSGSGSGSSGSSGSGSSGSGSGSSGSSGSGSGSSGGDD